MITSKSVRIGQCPNEKYRSELVKYSGLGAEKTCSTMDDSRLMTSLSSARVNVGIIDPITFPFTQAIVK